MSPSEALHILTPQPYTRQICSLAPLLSCCLPPFCHWVRCILKPSLADLLSALSWRTTLLCLQLGRPVWLCCFLCPLGEHRAPIQSFLFSGNRWEAWNQRRQLGKFGGWRRQGAAAWDGKEAPSPPPLDSFVAAQIPEVLRPPFGGGRQLGESTSSRCRELETMLGKDIPVSTEPLLQVLGLPATHVTA